MNTDNRRTLADGLERLNADKTVCCSNAALPEQTKKQTFTRCILLLQCLYITHSTINMALGSEILTIVADQRERVTALLVI